MYRYYIVYNCIDIHILYWYPINGYTAPHFETDPPFASNPQEFSAHRNDVQHRFAELTETLRRKQVPRQGWVSGPTITTQGRLAPCFKECVALLVTMVNVGPPRYLVWVCHVLISQTTNQTNRAHDPYAPSTSVYNSDYSDYPLLANWYHHPTAKCRGTHLGQIYGQILRWHQIRLDFKNCQLLLP